MRNAKNRPLLVASISKKRPGAYTKIHGNSTGCKKKKFFIENYSI